MGGRVPGAPPVLTTASGTHLLAGRIHSLWQILHGLVHQPFPGQAPIGCGAAAALAGAFAGVLAIHSVAQLQITLWAFLGTLKGQ